jgi:hypothetical protein
VSAAFSGKHRSDAVFHRVQAAGGAIDWKIFLENRKFLKKALDISFSFW